MTGEVDPLPGMAVEADDVLDAHRPQDPVRAVDEVRVGDLGLQPVFAEAENPFPWMSEAMDLKKEKNFFETRVIEYQNGGALSWD